MIGHLPDDCRIKSLNIGTTPYTQLKDNTNGLLHSTVLNILAKCPRITYLVLHGVDLNCETIYHIRNHLPSTLLSLDIAGNYIHDEDIRQLVTECPNLQFLDTSSTLVSTEKYLI